MPQSHDHSLGDGVFYAQEDCRGILVRIAILIVDLIVLIGLWFAVAFPYHIANPTIEARYVLLTYGLFLWLYMAVLKQSRVRTVGYRLTKSEIVTLHGQRPSILRMTFRLLLWLFGPINLIYDLVWAGIDSDRQSLRDRFAGTLLIRRGAEPIGTGEVHLERYFAFGCAVMYPRVMNRIAYTKREPAPLEVH